MDLLLPQLQCTCTCLALVSDRLLVPCCPHAVPAQVATVSPAGVNMAETLSTLRFADQAKRIKNQVGPSLPCGACPPVATAEHSSFGGGGEVTSPPPHASTSTQSNLPPLRCRLPLPLAPGPTRWQAVVNEDTDGDKAALTREIKRLNEELAAAARRAHLAAAHGSGGLEGAATGTPARLAAAADAMLSATSPSMGQEVRGGF